MAYTIDYFVGALVCPVCARTSDADESTDMQTKISKVPAMRPFGVGDRLDFDCDDVEGTGYFLVRKPIESGSFRLIEHWSCRYCGSPFNWAVLDLVDQVIEAIAAIKLDENTIASVNYVSEECVYDGWELRAGQLIKVR